MAVQALLVDEIVHADNINAENLRCPRETCRSATLILHGTAQILRTEVLENGQVTDVRLDEASHAFEVDVIECLQCNTRWHVKTREIAELERRNEILRQIVIQETGDDPYGMGVPN